VVFSGSDSIIIDQRATSVLDSVRRAMPRVARSVRRFTDQSGHRTPARHPPASVGDTSLASFLGRFARCRRRR
jgi:hypothetical protein